MENLLPVRQPIIRCELTHGHIVDGDCLGSICIVKVHGYELVNGVTLVIPVWGQILDDTFQQLWTRTEKFGYLLQQGLDANILEPVLAYRIDVDLGDNQECGEGLFHLLSIG